LLALKVRQNEIGAFQQGLPDMDWIGAVTQFNCERLHA
jgi:hypothetical protein